MGPIEHHLARRRINVAPACRIAITSGPVAWHNLGNMRSVVAVARLPPHDRWPESSSYPVGFRCAHSRRLEEGIG